MDASVEARRTLTVFGLWAFAVVQPALDVLRQYPQFLTAHHASTLEVWGAVAGLALLPPAVVSLALAVLGRWSPRAGAAAMVLTMSLLLSAILLPPVLRILDPSRHVVGAAAVVLASGGLTVVASRRVYASNLLAGSAVALPIFLILFLVRGGLPGTRLPLPDPGPGATRPLPLVVLVFDALPLSSLLDGEGRIDRNQTPNFAELADQSIWMRNGTTSADRTVVSVPALLTGQLPGDGRATFQRHPQNLFRLLAASHEVFALENTTLLCPPSLNRLVEGSSRPRVVGLLEDLGWIHLHALTPQTWRNQLPPIDETWRGFGRADATAGWDSWLESMQPGPRPRFHYAHLPIPHLPYLYLPDGTRYSERGTVWGGRLRDERTRSRDPWAALQAYQRHLLQVRLADRRLGDVLSRLRGTDLWDETLLVVTSDHGVSFAAGLSPRAVDANNSADILHVPLLIKLPEQARAGSVSWRNAELVDLVSTLAQAMDFPPPPGAFGPSMLEETAPARTRKVCLTGWRAPREWATGAQADPRVLDTVARRIAAFGDGIDPDAIYRLGDESGLVSRAVADLPRREVASLRCEVQNRDALLVVDRASGFLPAELVGTITPSRRGARLVVAVNGRIEAVTQPGSNWPEARSAPWAAIVRPGSLRDGANDVEVFLLDETDGAVTLLRGTADRQDSLLYVRLGRAPVPGVQEHGFIPIPSNPEYRWAGREAWLELATPHPAPSRLEVELLSADKTALALRVNDIALFEGEIPPGDWRRVFELPALGARLRIDLSAERPMDPHLPAPRAREHIAVRGLRLLP